jgi:5'-nucleotidase
MSGMAVDGRPADCIKLALASLWPERFGKGQRPDLVISGMNSGSNVGINVLYSGTVAAALEAAFLGLPAIAVSMTLGKGKPRYDVAARHARQAIEAILALPDGAKTALAPHACLNINIPLTEADGPMPPLFVCSMNVHGHVDAFQRNKNPLGETYFWSAGTPMEFHGTEPGSDVQELAGGKITITPLKYDLSDHQGIQQWRARLASVGEGKKQGNDKSRAPAGA